MTRIQAPLLIPPKRIRTSIISYKPYYVIQRRSVDTNQNPCPWTKNKLICAALGLTIMGASCQAGIIWLTSHTNPSRTTTLDAVACVPLSLSVTYRTLSCLIKSMSPRPPVLTENTWLKQYIASQDDLPFSQPNIENNHTSPGWPWLLNCVALGMLYSALTHLWIVKTMPIVMYLPLMALSLPAIACQIVIPARHTLTNQGLIGHIHVTNKMANVVETRRVNSTNL